MSNNIAIILGAIIIGASVTLSGPVTDAAQDMKAKTRMAACWSPDVTNGLPFLATQIATPDLNDSYPDDMSQHDQNNVSSSFAVKLAAFNYTGQSDNGGTINCAATITYSYTRPDGTKDLHDAGDLITYEVHPTKNGWAPAMDSDDIPDGVVSYTDDTPASPSGSSQ